MTHYNTPSVAGIEETVRNAAQVIADKPPTSLERDHGLIEIADGFVEIAVSHVPALVEKRDLRDWTNTNEVSVVIREAIDLALQKKAPKPATKKRGRPKKQEQPEDLVAAPVDESIQVE